VSELRRIALLVEYDGTELSGSQLQPGRRTVQGALEDALYAYDAEPDAEPRRVALAGRTDAGVHARGQVAAIELARRDDLATVRDALNHYLPPDVAVRAAAEVGDAFDPRRNASARCYRYRIEDGRPRSPLSRRDRWQVARPLDERAMAAAAALLPRTRRDWSAFAGPLETGRSPLRTLLNLTVARLAPHELEITMEADAFLPHQVRRTVGALERVGAGAQTSEAFAALVDGAPGGAGPTAPPQGLTLAAVQYPPGVVEWEMVA
jgi:tRNA pseudouridine38-40 synthase